MSGCGLWAWGTGMGKGRPGTSSGEGGGWGDRVGSWIDGNGIWNVVALPVGGVPVCCGGGQTFPVAEPVSGELLRAVAVTVECWVGWPPPEVSTAVHAATRANPRMATPTRAAAILTVDLRRGAGCCGVGRAMADEPPMRVPTRVGRGGCVAPGNTCVGRGGCPGGFACAPVPGSTRVGLGCPGVLVGPAVPGMSRVGRSGVFGCAAGPSGSTRVDCSGCAGGAAVSGSTLVGCGGCPATFARAASPDSSRVGWGGAPVGATGLSASSRVGWSGCAGGFVCAAGLPGSARVGWSGRSCGFDCAAASFGRARVCSGDWVVGCPGEGVGRTDVGFGGGRVPADSVVRGVAVVPNALSHWTIARRGVGCGGSGGACLRRCGRQPPVRRRSRSGRRRSWPCPGRQRHPVPRVSRDRPARGAAAGRSGARAVAAPGRCRRTGVAP